MRRNPIPNPFERLRAEADDTADEDPRVYGNSSRFVTADNSERLWAAGAVVLSGLRQMLDVAEEIVHQKLEGHAGVREQPAGRPAPTPHDGGYASVQFIDEREDDS